jgi:subtilisin family serine protease
LTPAQRAEVEQLPFVQRIQRIGGGLQAAEIQEECEDIPQVNSHLRQLNMIGLDVLHRNGYSGKGVTIAVFDNGFYQVDSLEGFAHLFQENRILATKDFVDGDESVFHTCSHCRHGTFVFSILAAKMPGQLIGSAPDANYLLLRTENDASETHQEEDNWVLAAEFADSMGAQVFTTSLGYSRFDAGEGDYSREDMDGNTAIITRAADIAASRGIIVVNSAGNNSTRGLSAPADGDSVLAIGAVDKCETYASFSSQGYSADGRVKPDLSAMGQMNFFLHPDGSIRQGNGTSFSCPTVSGLTACLLQAFPEAGVGDMYDALKRSADRFDNPDRFYGYGIPSGTNAFERLQTRYSASDLDTTLHYGDPFAAGAMLVFPNPARDRFWLRFGPEMVNLDFRVEVIDMMGRRLETQLIEVSANERQVSIVGGYPSGMYVVRVVAAEGKRSYFTEKVMLFR